MRYADGGGLTAEGRARREHVRLQAARLFEQDMDARRIARILRVSTKSVYQWRRAAGGLGLQGPGGCACKLDETSWRGCAPRWTDPALRLGHRPAVDAGPGHRLIARLSGVSYTLRGCRTCCTGLGFTPQVPARRAAERDEDAIAGWRSQTWAKVRG